MSGDEGNVPEVSEEEARAAYMLYRLSLLEPPPKPKREVPAEQAAREMAAEIARRNEQARLRAEQGEP